MDSLTVLERRFVVGALAVLGLTLLICGGVATQVAIAHMARDAAVCGPLNGHCGWCYGAAGLLIGALAAFGLAARVGWAKEQATSRAA